ncbi:MAG: hypothetical protein ACK5NG_06100 [Chthoniobacterales bacterium]
MQTSAPSEANDSIQNLWQTLQSLPLVEQSWPTQKNYSFLDWLQISDLEKTQSFKRDFDFVCKFSLQPIVAVAGLINSGKSSLIASFLSPQGQARVLRGISKNEGSQRFTLWLPSSWKEEQNLRILLDDTLSQVFQHAPELLKEDPESALAQQRDIDKLSVPLLAFDSALDTLQISLFDCPDIQRRQPGEDSSSPTNLRLKVLSAAGNICAAVILVASRKEIEVREFHEITTQLPAATQVYAINFLRRESPSDFLRDQAEILQASSEKSAPFSCYLAYDFEVAANRDFAPKIDPNFSATPNSSTGFPFFFEALPPDDTHDPNTPEAISSDRSLRNLTQKLPPETMLQRRQRELLGNLLSEIENKLQSIDSELSGTRHEITRAQRDLFDQLRALMQHGQDQRIKTDPEIALSLVESMRRTAPFDIRAALTLNHKIIKAFRSIAEGIQVLPASVADGFRRAKNALRPAAKEDFSVTSQSMESLLKIWSAGLKKSLSTEQETSPWSDDAVAIISRFQNEERTNMSDQQWDTLTREAWKSAPKMGARLFCLMPFLLALLAVAALPFDPTTITSHALIGITIKELVGATVAGGVVGGLFGISGSKLLQRDLEAYIGRQQLSNLFAIACDRLGLPRQIPPGQKPDFPDPKIAEIHNPNAFGIRHCAWIEAKTLSANFQKLHKQLEHGRDASKH